MCWHVSAREKVPTPGKVPTHANTSRCRHVPTSLILIIWTFFIWMLIWTDMCQYLKRCQHMGMCRHVPTHADIPDTNHMDFFYLQTGMLLGCAGMCQHLKKCRHLGRCRHMPARLGADTCRHVPISLILIIWTFFIWMLICTDMCQHLKRCQHMGMSRHVPTRQGADTCRHPW